MPQIQATGGSAPITLSGAVDVQAKSTFVTTGALVGTSETTLVLPIGTKSFKLQIAASETGAVTLTIAGETGGTSSELTSFDIYVGSSYTEDYLVGDSALTLYIKSSKTDTPVQLLYWT